MGNRHYMCNVSDNTSIRSEYLVGTRSAMECAKKYGKCTQGESITVRTLQGKPLSSVLWDPQSRKYINVSF